MSAPAAAPAEKLRGVPAPISHEAPLPAWMALHARYQAELKKARAAGDDARVTFLNYFFVKEEFGGAFAPRDRPR